MYSSCLCKCFKFKSVSSSSCKSRLFLTAFLAAFFLNGLAFGALQSGPRDNVSASVLNVKYDSIFTPRLFDM